MTAPASAAAQDAYDLSGRVVDAVTGQGVPNAVVEVAGLRSVLTGANGQFAFERVPMGSYELTVEAFGYGSLSTPIAVADATPYTIRLLPEPIAIDSILVDATTLDFDGRARDEERDINVYDAEVISDQGHTERTGWNGRFELDDTYEHVPLRMVIRAFGYMPLDTTFVPDDDDRYDFELIDDPIGQEMIAGQVRRLDERTRDPDGSFRPFRMRPTLDRDDVARYSRGSLQAMLESIYSMNVLRRVGCFVLDEVPVLSRAERTLVLQAIRAQEVERVEVIEFTIERRVLMMRVYTRRFFQELVATNRQLRTPNLVVSTRTCL